MSEFGPSVLGANVVNWPMPSEEHVHAVLVGYGIPKDAIELGIMHDIVQGWNFPTEPERMAALERTSRDYWRLTPEQHAARSRTAKAITVRGVAPEHRQQLGFYRTEDQRTRAIKDLRETSAARLRLHDSIEHEEALEEVYRRFPRSVRPDAIPGKRADWRPYPIDAPVPAQRTGEHERIAQPVQSDHVRVKDVINPSSTVYISAHARKHEHGEKIVRHKQVSRLGALATRAGAWARRKPSPQPATRYY